MYRMFQNLLRVLLDLHLLLFKKQNSFALAQTTQNNDENPQNYQNRLNVPFWNMRITAVKIQVLLHCFKGNGRVRVLVFNTTFNNISVMEVNIFFNQ